MAISHPELFGTSIQEKWIALENDWILHLDANMLDFQKMQLYPGSNCNRGNLGSFGRDFAQLKAVEAEMMAKLKRQQLRHPAAPTHQVVLNHPLVPNHRPALSHHQVVPKPQPVLQPVQVSLQMLLTQEELRILLHKRNSSAF